MDTEEQKAKYVIHEACREGQTAKVESLLSASPKLAHLRDLDERLPIHWAASFNHLPIISLLVSQPRFDPDEGDASGWTPLMMACSRKEGDGEEAAKLLISKGADVNAKNNNSQTALHLSSSKPLALPITKLLLSHKASPRTRDKRGQLPLHRAAAVGSVPMLRLLVEAGSPLNASDVDGMTALHHAVSEGHGDAALFLLLQGAEYDRKDKEGNIPLELAPDAKTRKFIVQAAEREGIDLE